MSAAPRKPETGVALPDLPRVRSEAGAAQQVSLISRMEFPEVQAVRQTQLLTPQMDYLLAAVPVVRLLLEALEEPGVFCL